MAQLHAAGGAASAEAGRRVQELEALHAISRILASPMAQQEMLAETLDVLESDLGMMRGTVMLVSPDGKELTVEVARDVPPLRHRQVRYRMGEGIVGRVVQTGKAAIVPRASQEQALLNRLHRRPPPGETEMSFVCVPISLGAETAGALAVDLPYDENRSLAEDARVLTIVASMIANDVRARRDAAAQHQALEAENLRLRSELEDRFRPENLIGNSNAMRDVYRAIHQVAGSDTTVLIRGESGTGKERVAHAVHFASPRADGPFVKVNCAALSEPLLESELFGHEKGAFSGAIRQRKGRIEEAEAGTLFLDEIGDFSPVVQVKLLRVLQERQFERVGSNETRKANVRVVAATHRDLEQAVDAGQYRHDLYYRINVFAIFLPPLRDRRDDILLLADHFVERYSRIMGKQVRRISTPAINMMVAYHWPGNVRELENCIERAVLLSTDGVIHGHHLPPTLQTSEASGTIGTGSLQERVNLFERDLIVDALKRTGGSIAAAARDLNATTRVVGYKIRNLGIDYRRYRPRS